MVWPLLGRIKLKPENNNFFGLYALRNAAKGEAHWIRRVTPKNMTLRFFTHCYKGYYITSATT